MYKAYKFRLYPDSEQKQLINKTFGCTRFVYNHFLNKCKELGYIKAYDMCKELKELEKEYIFLKEVDSCSLRCSIFNLEDRYKNFFQKRSGYPNFKNKYSKQSYRTNYIKNSYKNKLYSSIEIDLGIKDLVVTSDGEKYENPKVIEQREKRIKRLQRKLSRQVKGSKNYNKTKIRISKIHTKIKNTIKHNIINKIVEEHDIIVSETLTINKLNKNHKLSKYIMDASFYKICELIKWKTKIKGKYYYQIDKYFPSSKKCSHCENKTEKTNNLNIRKWQCEKCGSINDRDINASINIMFEGLKLHYQN